MPGHDHRNRIHPGRSRQRLRLPPVTLTHRTERIRRSEHVDDAGDSGSDVAVPPASLCAGGSLSASIIRTALRQNGMACRSPPSQSRPRTWTCLAIGRLHLSRWSVPRDAKPPVSAAAVTGRAWGPCSVTGGAKDKLRTTRAMPITRSQTVSHTVSESYLRLPICHEESQGEGPSPSVRCSTQRWSIRRAGVRDDLEYRRRGICTRAGLTKGALYSETFTSKGRSVPRTPRPSRDQRPDGMIRAMPRWSDAGRAQPKLIGIQPRRGPPVDSRLNGILLRDAHPAIRRSEHSSSSTNCAVRSRARRSGGRGTGTGRRFPTIPVKSWPA